MSLYMSDNQKTACIVLAILCATGLITMWSVMAYKNSLRPQQPSREDINQDACIKQGGVPILDGWQMERCEGLR